MHYLSLADHRKHMLLSTAVSRTRRYKLTQQINNHDKQPHKTTIILWVHFSTFTLSCHRLRVVASLYRLHRKEHFIPTCRSHKTAKSQHISWTTITARLFIQCTPRYESMGNVWPFGLFVLFLYGAKAAKVARRRWGWLWADDSLLMIRRAIVCVCLWRTTL